MENKAKKLEQFVLQKNEKLLQDFKDFIGDLFSLEVKIIDSTSKQEIMSWKQTIDGDMTISVPINAELNTEIVNLFSNIVSAAIQKREKFANFIAQLLGIGITLF